MVLFLPYSDFSVFAVMLCFFVAVSNYIYLSEDLLLLFFLFIWLFLCFYFIRTVVLYLFFFKTEYIYLLILRAFNIIQNMLILILYKVLWLYFRRFFEVKFNFIFYWFCIILNWRNFFYLTYALQLNNFFSFYLANFFSFYLMESTNSLFFNIQTVIWPLSYKWLRFYSIFLGFCEYYFISLSNTSLGYIMNKLILSYIFYRHVNYFKRGSFSKSGRNFKGRICVFHRGSGLKKNYIIIDFFRRLNLEGVIFRIVHDNNRNSFVGLVLYKNGLFSNIILSEGLQVGNTVYSGILGLLPEHYKVGSATFISSFNLFTVVNNLEIFPYKGSVLSRAAGTGVLIIARIGNLVSIKLKSGWVLYLLDKCFATLGYVSNFIDKAKIIGKAGVGRNKGFRPTVRGVAMNPCDHPHGGGEGKKPHPAAPFTPWGKFAKHTPTKKRKIDIINRRLFRIIR